MAGFRLLDTMIINIISFTNYFHCRGHFCNQMYFKLWYNCFIYLFIFLFFCPNSKSFHCVAMNLFFGLLQLCTSVKDQRGFYVRCHWRSVLFNCNWSDIFSQRGFGKFRWTCTQKTEITEHKAQTMWLLVSCSLSFSLWLPSSSPYVKCWHRCRK